MSKSKRRSTGKPRVEHSRTGLSKEALKRALLNNLFYVQGRFPAVATRNDWYLALAYAVRDRLLHRWLKTAFTYLEQGSRTACYLSAEFLMGPQLGNNLLNLGIQDEARAACRELGLNLDTLLAQEEEPGLGNGGLGRLAACYLDSMATLQLPGFGYGIRYEFGIFDQEIEDGWQVEVTDKWLRLGNPWELPRPEIHFNVKFGGHTEHFVDETGRHSVRWVPDRLVKGVAYDTPVLGYKVPTANLLRLWKAEAVESFDFQSFNVGDYYGAIEEKAVSENLTKVLYPNDELLQGKALRFEQQYFFVSCSLQDMIRIHLQRAGDVKSFHEKYAIQLNDTHPALAVPELMRLLMDVHQLGWNEAWDITRQSFAYTNHTLLPEALEKWPVAMFAHHLPRHLEIIYEINRLFLDDVRLRWPGDEGRVAKLSLIDESGERYVRMAHLACVGSYAINGVAELHTRLLREEVLRDFQELDPDKIRNKTNGVTPRRFVALCNPRLTRLVSGRIGEDWIRDLDQLRGLEKAADDASFREAWLEAKLENKRDLAAQILDSTGVEVDPASLFDIQVKRIHEYKRQHLSVLHIITQYLRLKDDPRRETTPRTFVFAGKAAPGYFMAKLIIKLITSVGRVVNRDPDVAGRLKVVFLPNFNVKNSERVYPAADLSEQISMAGKEASGTGNMKFALNGALTIGTLDGANVEIREEVGADNFFLFGLTADEVRDLWRQGYSPRQCYEGNPELKRSLDLVRDGVFSHGDKDLFRPLVDSLLLSDPYLLLADYPAYVERQDEVGRAFEDRERWARMSILTVARMGKFSSDRSIKEYAEDIWRVQPVDIQLDDGVVPPTEDDA